MTTDGGNVSSVSEFEAEEEESRKPNERLHGVVGVGKSGGGEGGERESDWVFKITRVVQGWTPERLVVGRTPLQVASVQARIRLRGSTSCDA